jgi:hypothetical protein
MTLPTPNGFVGYMFFEELLRQFLAYQFKQLTLHVNDPAIQFVDELFGRFGDTVRVQVKKWLASELNITVDVNFPREDMPLPFVCVVNVEENEKSSEAYLGDDGGLMYMGGRSVTASSSLDVEGTLSVFGEAQIEPDTRPRATEVRQLLSVPEARVTRILVGTDDTNTVMYLYVIIKALLMVNKLDLDHHVGARNLRISGSDFTHRPELFPTFVYMKQITLSYDMNFDVALSPMRTIGGVDVTLSSYLRGQS